MNNPLKYRVSINFQEIKLPPFDEILIIGANAPHGKLGISKSFELLNPNGFEIIEVEDEIIEAVFINKKILKKLSKEKIIKILRVNVFPYVSEGEIIRVDFKVIFSISSKEEDV